MKFLQLTLLIFYIITSSCNECSDTKFENYYEIIDDFIRMQIVDTSRIIELELIKVAQDSFDYDKWEEENICLTSPIPQPLLPRGVVSISKEQLRSYNLKGLIDKRDIDYMYNQIASFKDSLLNPNKINGKTIQASTLDSIRQHSTPTDFFVVLEKTYKAHALIKFSNPIISLDHKMMLFDMELYCGGECGGGIRYILKKENNKWRIKYQKRTWIS